jgi:hypothetical protein
LAKEKLRRNTTGVFDSEQSTRGRNGMMYDAVTGCLLALLGVLGLVLIALIIAILPHLLRGF